jgi:hypothetical protein
MPKFLVETIGRVASPMIGCSLLPKKRKEVDCWVAVHLLTPNFGDENNSFGGFRPSADRAMQNISFEFVGGPNDGKVLKGVLGDGNEVERLYLVSQHGRVGCKVKVVSPYAVEQLVNGDRKSDQQKPFQRHLYVVTHRHETDDEVAVRVEYI